VEEIFVPDAKLGKELASDRQHKETGTKKSK